MQRTWFGLLAGILAASARAAAPAADDAIKAMDTPAGVVVHLGATDGLFEIELAQRGKLLVHGLARDDAARDRARAALLAQGLYPLASVATWTDAARLPYASNLANMIVLDRDELGAAAPAPKEVLRVLAPFGTLYEKSGGAWKATQKPRPAEMDDWTHFDYAADGSTCSNDKAVRPIRQLQWITQAQPNPWEGNPAGYSPGGGVRIWGRYAVLDMEDRYAAKDPASKEDTWSLQCRDAFNGTPIWTIRRGRAAGTRRWSLVADQGLVFTYIKPTEDLAAIDIATGQVKHTFAGTAARDGRSGPFEETHYVRVAGERTVVAANGELKCFETKTGKPLWSFAREGMLLLGPSVDAAAGRVYAIVAKPGDRWVFSGRWPSNSSTQAVVAVDLATGKQAWENKEMVSVKIPASGPKSKAANRGIGQLLPVKDKLIVWGSAAISGGERPFIATLDAATGKTLFSDDEPFKRNYNVAAYNVLRQNGQVFFAGAFMHIWRYDPTSGKSAEVVGYGWNQRCTRFTATSDYLVFGQMGFYTPKDFSGEQITAARSGCAIGSFPANGLVYSTPNACGCITQVRGFNALTGEDVPPAAKEQSRRQTGTGVVALKRPAKPPADGEIVRDWGKQWRTDAGDAPPVKAGELDIVVSGQNHRVEGRRGGDTQWTFVTDARVSGPAVVHGETLYLGDHAGWVYAIARRDGTLKWKYLVAPSERLIVSNGQFESAWPVYGVAMLGDRVVASAGTHSALGGGVSVVLLDNAGKAAWRKNLHLPPNVIPPGGGRVTIIDHAFMNSVPKVEANTITLGDGGRKGAGLTFDADASEKDINTQIAAPPAKKK